MTSFWEEMGGLGWNGLGVGWDLDLGGKIFGRPDRKGQEKKDGKEKTPTPTSPTTTTTTAFPITSTPTSPSRVPRPRNDFTTIALSPQSSILLNPHDSSQDFRHFWASFSVLVRDIPPPPVSRFAILACYSSRFFFLLSRFRRHIYRPGVLVHGLGVGVFLASFSWAAIGFFGFLVPASTFNASSLRSSAFLRGRERGQSRRRDGGVGLVCGSHLMY